VADKDDERDKDELLAAIAAEGTDRPPPPWVPSLEERLRPDAVRAGPPATHSGPEVRDVLPEREKKPFWRWKR